MAPNCQCNLQAGLCLPENLDMGAILAESPANYNVKYGEREVVSTYLKSRATISAYMCGRHLNTTACNMLANLCTLTLHVKGHPLCSSLVTIERQNNDLSTRRVPRLFLPEGQVSSTLESESIPTRHGLAGRTTAPGLGRLNLTVVSYAADGQFLGMELAAGNLLQLCNASALEADAAWHFGTKYRSSCRIPALDLWHHQTVFYDLYVPYNRTLDVSPGKSKLYSVPNRILNNKENEDEEENKNWKLTSRFFLVDSVGGASGKEPKPRVVRYLSSLELRVSLLNTRESPDKPGRIHPPLAVLRYKEITLDEAKAGATVEVSFSVTYKMEMKESKKDIEIAVGVLSGLAVLLSAIEAWSWSRRAGKVAVDLSSLVKMVVATAGNLSYVFLCVIFFSCLYWFVFFKQQSYVHVVLPTGEQEDFIKQYLISAFSLKLFHTAALVASQISVDVFLLDWERPTLTGKVGGEQPISVWRTYMVANEWNELQTLRKTRISLQVVMVVFLMKVVGLEKLATADPHNRLWSEEGQYMAETSYVCRFALGVSIWAGLALLQSIFWVGVYTGAVEDKLAQFTDVCSLANISVFVMSHANFGYYIHGKSAHGTADTDMAGLLGQLQREADDLCGHRGLTAGSDHQTFSMSLPHKLRAYYDKVVTPSGSRGAPRARLTGAVLEGVVQAYSTMNRFLTRFLEHALRDLDYEVRDKMVLETVLDIEFQDMVAGEKAVFYQDNGHSFDAVLLYGHEFSLTVFEILVFSFVDLLAEDFLLAALVTYIVSKGLCMIRYVGGRTNLAAKTLIDRRFLI